MNSISGISTQQLWNAGNIEQTTTTQAPAAAKNETQIGASSDQYETKTAGESAKTPAGLELPRQGAVISYNSNDAAEFDVILADSSRAAATTKSSATTAAAKTDRAAWSKAVATLQNSAAFKAASSEVQQAVLAQCNNFPNSHSVNQLAKMMGTKWFGKMDLGDKQRAAKSIAYLAEVSYASKNTQQKTLINNTLNRILTDKVPLAFVKMDDDPGVITFGYAKTGSSGIYINQDLIPAGNAPFPKNSANARHAALSTIVHETSHQVNGDVNNCSYKYLQAEYRAWYVGYIAEYGQVPTRQQAFARCLTIINLYDNINAALYGTDTISNVLDWLNNKVTGDDYESKKMLKFLNQFIGAKSVNADNAQQIKAFLKSPVSNPKGAAPVPDPALKHDLDN